MISEERLHGFVGFMIERENIRLRREMGQKWPWTEDPILREYKFTNVHRSDDRTTREFKKIYDEHMGFHEWDVLYHCALYRYFGTAEWAKEIGWLLPHSSREIILRAGTMRRSGKKVFTSAYVVTNGGRSEPKEFVVADYLQAFWNSRELIHTAISLKGSWKAGYDLMHQLPGFGGSGFMAKEVLQDFLMCYPAIPIADRDTWTPMGPGARRGMNRMQYRPKDYTMPEAKFIVECQELRNQILQFGIWPVDWEPLTAHDVQFQLCEFDKYMRAKQGEGKPKSRYHPPRLEVVR